MIEQLKKEEEKFVNSPRLLHTLLNGQIQESMRCCGCESDITRSRPFNILNCLPCERLEEGISSSIAQTTEVCGRCNNLLQINSVVKPATLLLVNIDITQLNF